MSDSTVADRGAVIEALSYAWEGPSFSPPRFFDKWFRGLGSAYFFLFKKNLDVTNIQFPELLALLTSHTRSSPAPGAPTSLQFMSEPALRDLVEEVVNSLGDGLSDERSKAQAIELIADLYGPFLARSVVVHPLHGSCAAYLPPGLSLDLQSLCYESGYVHSAGRNVFMRRTDKAGREELLDSIDRHLRARVPDSIL